MKYYLSVAEHVTFFIYEIEKNSDTANSKKRIKTYSVISILGQITIFYFTLALEIRASVERFTVKENKQEYCVLWTKRDQNHWPTAYPSFALDDEMNNFECKQFSIWMNGCIDVLEFIDDSWHI